MPQKVTKPTVSFPMTFRDLQGHSSTVILFKCNFWATVCKTVRPMLSDLSVTLVYYGQTAGWIKIKLATELGLSPGHIVLDGSPTETGTEPHTSKFTGAGFACVRMSRRPCLLWSNGWMDQDATW